jgi:hypothetical protein
MRQNVFNFTGLLRPTHFKSAILWSAAALGATAGLSGIHGVHARQQGAHWTAEQAGRRMLALCDNYKGRCTLEGLPSYYGDAWLPISKRFCRRNIWVGFVHADGQMLDLVLNEKTGNLVYVLNGDKMATAADGRQINASVKTPAQAARLSMHVERALQMFPRKAEVALLRITAPNTREKAWHVIWQVWDKPRAVAYQIKVVLQQHDGRLIEATNSQEQALISTR